ncbi:FecR domain-containing protein [Olivibacter sp. SDN3]|uniref:FecR family protein n=1 Tax=Olivibacter sp. SDN3 TaxID=2764720 RepID=UPI0016519AA2|nr:FecR family protein [Olivibacter sp. SDN3]QNL51671.1 FecR domain-containing protein [Olivibacter sp. SDN3]
MTEDQWKELYSRYLNKQCSPEEIRRLLRHFELEGNTSFLRNRIERELNFSSTPASDSKAVEERLDRIHRRLMGEIAPKQKRRSFTFWLPYAAAIVLLAIGLTWFLGNEVWNGKRVITSPLADITAGGNRATLKFADGRTIDLSDKQYGIVVNNDIHYADGNPVLTGKNDAESSGMNDAETIEHQLLELITPRGGTYQLTLPDGSKVWLNAASSLRYPATFKGEKREVYLSGEAYFEVASKKDQPFVVQSAKQQVKVLGTSFNISAYQEEVGVRTTLVEGSVAITNFQSDKIVQLQPGKQCLVDEGKTSISDIDVAAATAWKDGLLNFNETELRELMNQLSRWYNVSVEYQGDIAPTYYYGYISRDEKLSKVLELLKESGLNFRMERTGEINRLIVTP